MNSSRCKINRNKLDALRAEVDALKRLQAGTAVELTALLPAILGAVAARFRKRKSMSDETARHENPRPNIRKQAQ